MPAVGRLSPGYRGSSVGRAPTVAGVLERVLERDVFFREAAVQLGSSGRRGGGLRQGDFAGGRDLAC